jgi:hypothetical protein
MRGNFMSIINNKQQRVTFSFPPNIFLIPESRSKIFNGLGREKGDIKASRDGGCNRE